MLENVSIVLVSPSHPGNIGAVARAMKNMGLSQLRLVNPKCFPHHEATERASGAADVLERATTFSCTKTAIADCSKVYATSSRERTLRWPQMTASEVATEILNFNHNQAVAILFGAERTGLSNEELQLADTHLVIPANEVYPSLNLAQAVQIVTYELFKVSLEGVAPNDLEISEQATKAAFEGMIGHFEDVLYSIDAWDPAHPKKLMPKVRRLLTKAMCTQEEINIVRGLLNIFGTKIKHVK